MFLYYITQFNIFHKMNGLNVLMKKTGHMIFVTFACMVILASFSARSAVSALNCSQYSMNDNDGYWDAVKKVSIMYLDRLL